MYLLNAPVEITWEILPTTNPPALSDLDLLIIDPLDNRSYLTAPLAPANYQAPTAVANGYAKYTITPHLEGFWRIRLVQGNEALYKILSKVEMFVFDNTTTTSPYSEDIGRPVPYDINFFLQGYIVANEIFGTFIASRAITIATNAPDSKIIAEESPEFYDVTFKILHNDVEVGSIVFVKNSLTGVLTISAINLVPGDKLQIKSGTGIIDERIHDIAINIVGCCTVVPCTVL